MNPILLVIIAALVVGCVAVWYIGTVRSRQVRDRFGPEYERMRNRTGSVHEAEAALAARTKRVEKFHIKPLTTEERSRFAEVWGHIQRLFVDDPKGAIGEADHLVNEVMTARGYPIAEFEQRAADVSVDHAHVVQHYRAARAIAERQANDEVSTEDLRLAVIHYRALFEDLLEERTSVRTGR